MDGECVRYVFRNAKPPERDARLTFHLPVSRKHIDLALMFFAIDLAGNFVRFFPSPHKNAEFISPVLPIPDRERPPAGHRHAHLADIFRYLISSHVTNFLTRSGSGLNRMLRLQISKTPAVQFMLHQNIRLRFGRPRMILCCQRRRRRNAFKTATRRN
jgi:hypothetical protein